MPNRRIFIKTAAAASLGAALPLSAFQQLVAGNRKKEVGLITYTIQHEFEADYKKALEKVSQVGYKFVEMGDCPGTSVKDFLSFLKSLGLRALAGGSSMSDFQTDLPALIKNTQALEKEYLICYWPWTDDGKNKKADDFKHVADELNRIGKVCKQEGLRFAYHNHDLEFKQTEGQVPYDLILASTDPALVAMEMDVYWTYKGFHDPVQYFERYPGRFELLHIKDMVDSPEKQFACVGDGMIDFQRIFNKFELAGTRHIIVEHDQPENPMECIERSYNHIQKLDWSL